MLASPYVHRLQFRNGQSFHCQRPLLQDTIVDDDGDEVTNCEDDQSCKIQLDGKNSNDLSALCRDVIDVTGNRLIKRKAVAVAAWINFKYHTNRRRGVGGNPPADTNWRNTDKSSYLARFNETEFLKGISALWAKLHKQNKKLKERASNQVEEPTRP